MKEKTPDVTFTPPVYDKKKLMADESLLPEGWEAVNGDDGRTYWWHVDTNETTWTRPEKIVAKPGVASGYVAKLQAEQPAARRGPDCASSNTGVASLAKRFSGMATAPAPAAAPAPKKGAAPSSGSAPTTPASSGGAPDLEKRSSALSVDAMKKYNEAKAAMRQKESSGERRGPIDLTK